MSLVPRELHMPLHHLKHWNPIKIDALGLVTLLGADEVNRSIGTLQRRHFTECLPLLAAFMIAGNTFTTEQAGFALYNITEGIHTTELKGWFTRWLSSQPAQNGTTIFRWRVQDECPNFHRIQYIAWTIGFLAITPLFVCTILIGDWYGVGNSVALVVSILVRKFLLWQLRTGLNSAVVPKPPAPELSKDDGTVLPRYNPDSEKQRTSIDTEERQLHHADTQPNEGDDVTIFITRADGRMVTIYAPRSILHTFVRDVKLPSPQAYHFARWIGWAAFGAHIIVLGMSTLFTQIYTVVLLVFGTWALCHGFDLDIGHSYDVRDEADGTQTRLTTTSFTSRLKVTREDPATKNTKGELMDSRKFAYVRAEPTHNQEEMLRHWSMLPFKGVPWYDSYNQAKLNHANYKEKANPYAASLAADSPPQSPSKQSDRSTGSDTLRGSP